MRYVLALIFLLAPTLSFAQDTIPFVVDGQNIISSKDKAEMIKIMAEHAKKGQYLFFVTAKALPRTDEFSPWFFKKYKISDEIKNHSFLFGIFAKEKRIMGEPGKELPRELVTGDLLDSVFSKAEMLDKETGRVTKSKQALNFVRAYFIVLGDKK